jgi:hypothetical protein
VRFDAAELVEEWVPAEGPDAAFDWLRRGQSAGYPTRVNDVVTPCGR